jgi:hypothetical protein
MQDDGGKNRASQNHINHNENLNAHHVEVHESHKEE